jgi:hypothetical protein
LLAWVVLGVVIYVIAPKDDENQALETLLGDQYDKLERDSEDEQSEVEEKSARRKE